MLHVPVADLVVDNVQVVVPIAALDVRKNVVVYVIRHARHYVLAHALEIVTQHVLSPVEITGAVQHVQQVATKRVRNVLVLAQQLAALMVVRLHAMRVAQTTALERAQERAITLVRAHVKIHVKEHAKPHLLQHHLIKSMVHGNHQASKSL